jgi:hypothetical protein
VITIVGDGSFQYSIQSLWNAAQLHLPMLIVVCTLLTRFSVLKQKAFARTGKLFPIIVIQEASDF